MRSDRLLVSALVSSLVLIGLLAGTARRLDHALTAENDRGIHRLGAFAARLLNEAHRVNDELQMETLIKMLAAIHGISFAAIVDDEGKVIAHSEPSFIGRRLEASTAALWHVPLADRARWGTLIFPMNDRSPHRAARKLMRQWSIGAAAFWMGWMLLTGFSERARAIRDKEKSELERALRESHANGLRQLEKEARQRLLWNLWIQEALRRAPGPLILLDERQRILAYNPSAAPLIAPDASTSCLGLSWQDVPFLKPLAAPLEQSLERPGRIFELRPTPAILITRLWSIPGPDQRAAGTWIESIPSGPS